jgi:hypothetical protein
MDSVEALAERLGRLERQNRRLKWLAFTILVVATVAWLGIGSAGHERQASAAGVQPVRSVDAEVFRLVDSNGRLRASLFMGEGGPCLGFLDEAGKTRADLIVTKDGTAFFLRDANGTARVVMGATGAGQGFSLADARGKEIWSAPPVIEAQRQLEPPRKTEPPPASEPWKNKDNWSRLQEGMTEAQVLSILGPPTGRDTYSALGITHLSYGSYNTYVDIDAKTRRVKNWRAPAQ